MIFYFRVINNYAKFFLAFSLISLVVVLFSFVFPTIFDLYNDQRLLLCIIVLFSFLVSVFLVLMDSRVDLYELVKVNFFPLMSASMFVILSIPFLSGKYAIVEPLMYLFYLSAISISGYFFSFDRLLNEKIITFIVLVSAACALYGASSLNLYFLLALDNKTDFSSYIPAGFGNIRYWSHLATWILPILPVSALVGPLSRNYLGRCFVAFGAGTWWWIVFLSTARGSLVSIFLGAVIVFIFFGKYALPWLKKFILYFFCGLAIWFIFSLIIPFLFLEDVSLRKIGDSISVRMLFYGEAFRMSLVNFPLGMGPQSWLTHATITEAEAKFPRYAHPHNMYLMWAAEYGWLIILALFTVVVQVWKYLRAKRVELLESGDTDSIILLTGLLASTVAALMHAGVSAVFIAPGSMLIGFFVLIWFWALIQPCRLNQSIPFIFSKKEGRVKLVCMMFFLVFILLFGIIWLRNILIYYGDMSRDVNFYVENVENKFYPRFWLHGDFPRRDVLPEDANK